jgi:alkanesulfonate monooxygenase SsuD/methylene tetrahydromethanopterin reductase-like flavin-dependent oxidoreductase (luciferase family)
MFIMRFTERAYTNYTEEDVRNSPNGAHRVTFSNSHFDPAVASKQYNYYLDEYEYCEEIGFDGLMLNEHHSTPTSLGAAMNLEAAILARITKKAKIVLMGNPLPIHDNPLRLAEELVEIDCISEGRLVSGFVRGGGTESWATNASPVHNRERFEEAHDLIIKAWTTPGPFRWEGKHYHFRAVNPFQLPLQKPHPPVWIPGSGSSETVDWCAEHHYPYFYLGIVPSTFHYMQEIYAEAARRYGYEAGPQHFGYMLPVHVQDTDEEAREAGRGFLEALVGVGRVPMPREYSFPPGYNRVVRDERTDSEREAKVRQARLSDPFRTGPVTDEIYQAMIDDNRFVIGSPDTVIRKIREVLSNVRPGILTIWTNDGSITHKDTMRCLELIGQEVLPAVREMGEELELTDPFQKSP